MNSDITSYYLISISDYDTKYKYIIPEEDVIMVKQFPILYVDKYCPDYMDGFYYFQDMSIPIIKLRRFLYPSSDTLSYIRDIKDIIIIKIDRNDFIGISDIEIEGLISSDRLANYTFFKERINLFYNNERVAIDEFELKDDVRSRVLHIDLNLIYRQLLNSYNTAITTSITAISAQLRKTGISSTTRYHEFSRMVEDKEKVTTNNLSNLYMVVKVGDLRIGLESKDIIASYHKIGKYQSYNFSHDYYLGIKKSQVGSSYIYDLRKYIFPETKPEESEINLLINSQNTSITLIVDAIDGYIEAQYAKILDDIPLINGNPNSIISSILVDSQSNIVFLIDQSKLINGLIHNNKGLLTHISEYSLPAKMKSTTYTFSGILDYLLWFGEKEKYGIPYQNILSIDFFPDPEPSFWNTNKISLKNFIDFPLFHLYNELGLEKPQIPVLVYLQYKEQYFAIIIPDLNVELMEPKNVGGLDKITIEKLLGLNNPIFKDYYEFDEFIGYMIDLDVIAQMVPKIEEIPQIKEEIQREVIGEFVLVTTTANDFMFPLEELERFVKFDRNQDRSTLEIYELNGKEITKYEGKNTIGLKLKESDHIFSTDGDYDIIEIYDDQLRGNNTAILDRSSTPVIIRSYIKG